MAEPTCPRCHDTGRITVRVQSPMSYVCAGDPPDDARNVVGVDCYACSPWPTKVEASHA